MEVFKGNFVCCVIKLKEDGEEVLFMYIRGLFYVSCDLTLKSLDVGKGSN